MLSGRWNVELLPDGLLPIGADEDPFSILLGYMRRPTAFPLLWIREKGFDYVTYNKLITEANFLGLSDLRAWIKERMYLKAVKTGLKMKIHASCFKSVSVYENALFLHNEEPMVPKLKLLGGDKPHKVEGAFHNAAANTPSIDPLPTEDLELVQAFEVKISSKGRYKCPNGCPMCEFPEECAATNMGCLPCH